MTRRLMASWTLPLVVLGCADGPTEPGSDLAVLSLAVVSGEAQSTFEHTLLPGPVVVKLTDGSGKPVKGESVTFRAVVGGGTAWAGSSVTDRNGLARDWWELGEAEGVPDENQVLEARWVDPRNGNRVVLATVRATSIPLEGLEIQCRYPTDPPDVWEPDPSGLDAHCRGASGEQRAPILLEGQTWQLAFRAVNADGVVPRLPLAFYSFGGGGVSVPFAYTDENGVVVTSFTAHYDPNPFTNSLDVVNEALGGTLLPLDFRSGS